MKSLYEINNDLNAFLSILSNDFMTTFYARNADDMDMMLIKYKTGEQEIVDVPKGSFKYDIIAKTVKSVIEHEKNMEEQENEQ